MVEIFSLTQCVSTIDGVLLLAIIPAIAFGLFLFSLKFNVPFIGILASSLFIVFALFFNACSGIIAFIITLFAIMSLVFFVVRLWALINIKL